MNSEGIPGLYPSNQNHPWNDFVLSQLIDVPQWSGDCWQNGISFSLNIFDKYGPYRYRGSQMNQDIKCINASHGLVVGHLCCSQLFRQIVFVSVSVKMDIAVNLVSWRTLLCAWPFSNYKCYMLLLCLFCLARETAG